MSRVKSLVPKYEKLLVKLSTKESNDIIEVVIKDLKAIDKDLDFGQLHGVN